MCDIIYYVGLGACMVLSVSGSVQFSTLLESYTSLKYTDQYNIALEYRERSEHSGFKAAFPLAE